MAYPDASEGFQSGLALLERIRASGNPDHLGVDLAAALGILLADRAGVEGNGLLLLALANTVMRASFTMRQAHAILADCRGSA
jgi:hypothetical protein